MVFIHAMTNGTGNRRDTNRMRIGIDLDNTIICYDGLFHREAVARRWIDPSTPTDKESVRSALCDIGREDDWTVLQGHIYGPGLSAARPYPGVREFLYACERFGVDWFIVSHKTRYPYAGPRHDLQVFATKWLTSNRIFVEHQTGSADTQIYFESTREEKRARIAALGCQWFVDDLPRFLADPQFPMGVQRILFDPHDRHTDEESLQRARSWTTIRDVVFQLQGHA